MTQDFIPCDREQPFLLPPDVREWLPEDHLAWFVIDAVGVMDLAAFYAAYRQDGHGRAAYERAVMVALLLYCWTRGTRSSRAIERACVEDVACRVIAAQQRPDHATIARFVVRHERALGELFGEVLVLCADAGLASVGVIAIDGTKVAANANRDRTMNHEQLAKAIVQEQIATDAADDELQRTATSCRPSWPSRRVGRCGCVRPSAGSTSDAPKKPSRFRARVPSASRTPSDDWTRRCGLSGAPTRPTRPIARGVSGAPVAGSAPPRRPKPYTPPATPAGKVNITDLDSKLVKGMRGWIQGYNAQAVCNDQHLIVAAEVMTASPDFGHLGPMLAAARRELANAGVTKPPDVVVADAGYWHLEQMNQITGEGIPVLIPPDSSRRANKPRRPGWDGGAYDFMRSVLSTELGSELYRQRAQLIEPIFGNTKHNRGFTRFHRRGRSAARTEWRLMATTHNLCKLHQHFTGAPS
jgi:transposase